MTPGTIPQTVLFPDLFAKPLVATFDREQASSDGGAVLLTAAGAGVRRGEGRSPGVWPPDAHRGRFGTRLRT